jgi:hypothetical protein
MAPNMSSSTTTASNSRSTAREAKAAGKGTAGVDRDRAYARANSPARAGTTLLIIIPIAVALHNREKGIPGAMGSRIGRQRSARSGKMQVAAMADRSSRPRLARRTCAITSAKAIPRKAK